MVITNLRSIFHYSVTVINYSNPTWGYGTKSKARFRIRIMFTLRLRIMFRLRLRLRIMFRLRLRFSFVAGIFFQAKLKRVI